MIVHDDHRVGGRDDRRSKHFPRMRDAFVHAAARNFLHPQKAIARIEQEDAQRLLCAATASPARANRITSSGVSIFCSRQLSLRRCAAELETRSRARSLSRRPMPGDLRNLIDACSGSDRRSKCRSAASSLLATSDSSSRRASRCAAESRSTRRSSARPRRARSVFPADDRLRSRGIFSCAIF